MAPEHLAIAERIVFFLNIYHALWYARTAICTHNEGHSGLTWRHSNV